MEFQDHFSHVAANYTKYRPDYPVELFAYLSSIAPGHACAWDCGTGSGQSAVALAPYFQQVIATDPSAEQIRHAEPRSNVHYAVAPAEKTEIPGDTVDLITVAQALHWFDLPTFYGEVRRVSRPGAVLACWCYGLLQAAPEIDALLRTLYADTLGSCWPPERALVDEEYRTVPFPFDEESPPTFRMTHDWDLPRLVGYLRTWSATQRYLAQHGVDPVAQISDRLETLWGDPAQCRRIVWPVSLRVGRINC